MRSECIQVKNSPVDIFAAVRAISLLRNVIFFASRGARCSTVNLTFQHVYNFRNSSQLVLNDLKVSFFIIRQKFFTNALLRM